MVEEVVVEEVAVEEVKVSLVEEAEPAVGGSGVGDCLVEEAELVVGGGVLLVGAVGPVGGAVASS